MTSIFNGLPLEKETCLSVYLYLMTQSHIFIVGLRSRGCVVHMKLLLHGHCSLFWQFVTVDVTADILFSAFTTGVDDDDLRSGAVVT